MTAPTIPSAGQWPDASLRPSADAPPAEWARFYRDHCGWIVLPTAGPRDVLSYAISMYSEAIASYAADHASDVPEDVAGEMWDDARSIAGATLGRPIGYIYKAWTAKVAVAADVTDEMIAQAWEPLERSPGPRAEADHRGICILPMRSCKGLPVCLVDVDAGHGDSPPGDIDGPWGWGLDGPKASTPRGGLHTLVLGTGRETASADLGPGVDVVAGGGTTIPVPAGSATPERQWLRWDAPVVAPDELRKRGRKKAPPRVTAAGGGAQAGHATREPGDDFEEEGRAAALLSAEVGDGERNWSAATIVGILARPFACPEDFVRAALILCAEVMDGRSATRDDIAAEQARWSHALTRGPRDGEFAAEVLATWVRGRDTARRPWTEAKARTVALSLWKTCDRREEGNAGAEDYGVGPVLAARLDTWPALPSAPPPPLAVNAPPPADATPATAAHAPLSDVPYPPPPPAVAQAAAAATREPRGHGVVAIDSPWRGGIDPRTYALTLGEDYTREDLQRDLEREPIRIDAVMPAVDFMTGMPSTAPDLLTPPVQFGWGEAMHTAKRGISAGDFIAVGASSAGAGKTTFLAWLANGLALQTACRILGVNGYENRPVVLPVWVSEMPKKLELYGRLVSSYLGFDSACLALGPSAHEDAGVRTMAASLGMTPQEVVAKARAMEALHGNDERFPLCTARHKVIRRISLSKLPRVSRRAGVVVHHRTGPDLVDHLADAVVCLREDLAVLAGVSADKVFPLIIIDPVQRFAGDGESEKRAIDAILTASNEVLCGELECAVITTNDTTKKAAGGVTLEAFLSADAPSLMADIFAGTQAIMHTASDVIAVHPERPDPSRPGKARQWTRLLRSRSSGESSVAYPYEWSKATGRLMPGAPEPLRDPPQQADRRGQGSAPPPPTSTRLVPGFVQRSPREHAGMQD